MLAVYFVPKPKRNRVARRSLWCGFLVLVLAPVVFRAVSMWLPAEKIVLRNQRALLPGGKKIHERADRLSERA